jgi:molecular chaperone GrpE (heat shock protein)
MKISKINTIGEKFDHNYHNAVEYKNSEDVEEGYIISELKPGYLYNGKLINVADVIVSAGNK